MYLKSACRLSHAFLVCMIVFLCSTVSARINAGVNEQNSDPTDDTQLRYVAFGTSKTWGATLESQYDAYPYLLSSDADNLAIRATGPSFPGICTQTMVGDKIYDVIMLEFFDRAQDGLKLLAQRLRQRFPNAMIILIQLWNPKFFRYLGKGRDISMIEWITDHGFDRLRPNGMSRSQLERELEATSSDDWGDIVIEGRMNVLEDVANTVGAYILKGPPFQIDSYKTADKKALMLSSMHMFADDWYHPSEEGHIAIAEAVKELIKNNPVKRSDEVGTWGKGDLCHTWYETGEVKIPVSEGVTVEQFQPKKYALQFPSTGGTLRITNPYELPRTLMLTYMTSGPTTSIYPKTEVKIHNSRVQSAIVEPVCNHYEHPVHVSTNENVGIVYPGENFVYILPLETTEQPFRILAVALINGNEVISSGNFMAVSRSF